MMTQDLCDIQKMMHIIDSCGAASPKEYGQYLQNKHTKKSKRQ